MKHWSAVKGVNIESPVLDTFPASVLADMATAGRELRECCRVLDKGGINLVGEVLKGQGTFYEDDHYPEGDVYDTDTASQYYYHAHRGIPGEHGHFHTFVRADAIPDSIAPVPYDGDEAWPEGEDRIAHLGAVSMDRSGFPLGVFMTNRWVTGETWFSAPDVGSLLDRFSIDHAYPSWPTNRWLTALFRLYRPQIESLLTHRDQVIAAWSDSHPDRDVYEDRELEMTGWIRLYPDQHMADLDALLDR